MEKSIELKAKDGFHARPASMFAKLAMGFPGDVKIAFNGKEINGKSVMSILTLGATCGSEVILKLNGDGADDMMAQLIAFIETME